MAPKDAVRCRSKPERKKVFPEGLETFAGSLGLAGCLAFHNGDNLVFWSQNYKCAFVPVSKHFLQTWSLLNRRAHCLDLDLNGNGPGVTFDGSFSSFLIGRS